MFEWDVGACLNAFATHQFSTLTTIFGHLETLDMNKYVCTFLYIIPKLFFFCLQIFYQEVPSANKAGLPGSPEKKKRRNKKQ